MLETITETVMLRGAAWKLNQAKDLEVLIEGPAGTGKTFSVLLKCLQTAETYPRSRQLITRKTRASMTESVLVTLEEKVMPPGHPAKIGPTRGGRKSYRLDNGSEIVVEGLNNVERIMSTEYDRIYCFESTEMVEDDHEKLLTRLRNNMTPYHQIAADCNPGQPSHWLNRRAGAGDMLRLRSRHEHNPMLHEGKGGDWTEAGKVYLQTLGKLHGARRLRLLDGKWVAQEGVVYPQWNPEVHIIDKPLSEIRYYIATVDWGYTAPGACLVWGIDNDRRAYCVAQYYHTKRLLGWWKKRFRDLHKEFKIKKFLADGAEPGHIETCRRHRIPMFEYYKAPGSIELGIRYVEERLEVDDSGRAELYFIRDNLRERDPELYENREVCSTEEEFENYLYPEKREGRNASEEPVDEYNHGLDCVRALALDLDRGKRLKRDTSNKKPAVPEPVAREIEEAKKLNKAAKTFNDLVRRQRKSRRSRPAF